MDSLPVFLNVAGKKCVVVGGGVVASRKCKLLWNAGADVHVVAESVSAELKTHCEKHNTTAIEQAFRPENLDGAMLVIAATDNAELNEQISKLATDAGALVNVVDQPALCSFIVPSIVDKSPVVIAISSGGSSPILSRRLKEVIETVVPGKIGELAKLIKQYRGKVQAEIKSFPQRVRFWENFFESEIPELVYSGKHTLATELLEQQISSGGDISNAGEVYLVGAGPGDPDLLTLRALRLMYQADVVLYDRLVSAEIMAKLRPDAEQIYVGKQQANHAVEQESINSMLVRFAQQGKKVLRLKGGDPFVFGRGGEEIQRLAAANIAFQVVPGITAASGCAAYAGIPLTHRDCSQSVRFLTGHAKEGELSHDWSLLAKEQQTLVFYMGLTGLNSIAEKLMEHGMRKDMPIAVIQQGTTKNQRVISTDLENIVAVAEEAKIRPPTLIIIGEVVKLRDELAWFEEG